MIGDIARCSLSPNVVAVSLCSPTPTAVAFVGFDEVEEGAVVSVVDSAACAASATATTTAPLLSPGAEGLTVEVDLPPTAPSLNPLEEETDDDGGSASAPLPPVGCPLPPPNHANPEPEPDDAIDTLQLLPAREARVVRRGWRSKGTRGSLIIVGRGGKGS